MAEQEKKKPEKKIIVDEDWKEQARREKEILAAQEQAERKKGEAPRRRGRLPQGDFSGLLGMLTTQTMLAFGALVPEGEEKKEPDLELAKYHIDMLGSLEAKTKGNLTEQEAKILSDTLHQMRMLYVQLAEGKD